MCTSHRSLRAGDSFQTVGGDVNDLSLFLAKYKATVYNYSRRACCFLRSEISLLTITLSCYPKAKNRRQNCKRLTAIGATAFSEKSDIGGILMSDKFSAAVCSNWYIEMNDG
jgi:hypothetical protein